MLERVVIINDMATARGGATALALLSAKLLRARGIAVSYVTGDAGDNGELAALGVEVIAANGAELLQQSPLKSALVGLNDPTTRRLVADVVKRHDSARTIYHVHGWAQTLSPGIFTPLQKVAARTFVHAHDFFLACPNAVFFDFRASRDCTLRPLSPACVLKNCDKRAYSHKLWRVARQAVLRHAFDQSWPWAGVVLIHPAMRPQMVGAGYDAGRLRVVRNPALAFSQTRIRAEDNRDFVFVGRIEPDKGIGELALAAARAAVPLMVIGEGPMREALARAYPDIRFTGWKSRAEIGRLVKTARALVMPSRFREPFGLVAIEAATSGLPVIVPQNALLAPEITAGGFGLSCDIRNPDAFADTLVVMRDLDRDTLKGMSARGMSGAADLALDPAIWIDRQIDLYEQALGSGGGR